MILGKCLFLSVEEFWREGRDVNLRRGWEFFRIGLAERIGRVRSEGDNFGMR